MKIVFGASLSLLKEDLTNQKPSASGFWLERRNNDTAEVFSLLKTEECGIDFDEDAPWKLNIEIIDAIMRRQQ